MGVSRVFERDTMNQHLVTEAANDEGVIDVTEPSVDVDMSIDIRQDDLTMFEADAGRLLLQSGEMDDDVYLEPTPSPEGVKTEIVVGVETTKLTEVEPAEPVSPEVEDANTSTITMRMD